MKTVKLKKYVLARYEDPSPFPLGDLSIKVEGLPKYEGAEVRLVAKMNDTVVAKLALTDKSNTVTINQDLLDCGEFKAAVVVFSKGVKVEEYEIEPLIITNVDGAFDADPVIAQLQRKIEMLENALKAAKNKLNATTNALVRFAFKDYQNNVYLSGGDIDAFIKEFGFDEVKDQIKNILGVKENEEN